MPGIFPRKSKSAIFNWWCRFARNEEDFARIARALEGLDNPLIPDTNAFHHALRHIGDALEGMDPTKINPRKLLDELGDDFSFKRLDQLDQFGRSHIAQYLHRVGQIAQLLKTYGHLSEDALVGFARLYKTMSLDLPLWHNTVRDTARDLMEAMDAFDSNAGGSALARTLEDFKLATDGLSDADRATAPLKISSEIVNVYGVMFNYRPLKNMRGLVIQNGKPYLKPFVGVQWVTPAGILDPVAAKKGLQLPMQYTPDLSEAQRAQYRLTVRTADIKERLSVPFAENHRSNSVKMDFREPKTFFNDHEGPGKKSQFTSDGDLLLEVTEVSLLPHKF